MRRKYKVRRGGYLITILESRMIQPRDKKILETLETRKDGI